MKNAKLIILFNFFWMFIPVIAILVPFMMSLGATMTDVFLLNSFFGLTMVLTEVPSGYLADIVGRKKSVMLGGLVSGIGFTVLFFSTTLFHLYIYEFIIAVGLALISGADYALLFDSLKEQTEVSRKVQATWTSRFMMASFLGEACAAVVAGFASLISMSTIILATMIFGWGPFLISFFMYEPYVKKMDKTTHKENFKQVLNYLFTDSKFLRALFVNFVIWSLSTMCVVWLIQKYWQENDLPLMYFGFIWAGYSIVGALSNHFSHALEECLGSKVLLAMCSLLVCMAYLVIPYVGFITGTVLLSLFYISRGVFQPIFKEGFNHRLKEEFRATANSIYSLVFRMSFMVIGPLLGLYVDKFNLMGLFTVLGTVFLGLFVFLLIPFLSLED